MESEEEIYNLDIFFEVIARQPLALHHIINNEIPEIINLDEFFNGLANHSLRRIEDLPPEMIQKIAEELDVISLFCFSTANSEIERITHNICCRRLSYGFHDYFTSCRFCESRLLCEQCVKEDCFWTHPSCIWLFAIKNG